MDSFLTLEVEPVATNSGEGPTAFAGFAAGSEIHWGISCAAGPGDDDEDDEDPGTGGGGSGNIDPDDDDYAGQEDDDDGDEDPLWAARVGGTPPFAALQQSML